jgi:hypothetical protein
MKENSILVVTCLLSILLSGLGGVTFTLSARGLRRLRRRRLAA